MVYHYLLVARPGSVLLLILVLPEINPENIHMGQNMRFGTLTSVDSDMPMQPPLKLRNSK